MNVADKLQQLADMHRRGELTDAEFAMAKQATLSTAEPTSGAPGQLPLMPGWPNNFKKNSADQVSVWKRYRLVIAIFAVMIFIVIAVLMFGMFFASQLKISPSALGNGNLPNQ